MWLHHRFKTRPNPDDPATTDALPPVDRAGQGWHRAQTMLFAGRDQGHRASFPMKKLPLVAFMDNWFAYLNNIARCQRLPYWRIRR